MSTPSTEDSGAFTPVIHAVVGSGLAGMSGDGEPAVSGQLKNPFAVAVDSTGALRGDGPLTSAPSRRPAQDHTGRGPGRQGIFVPRDPSPSPPARDPGRDPAARRPGREAYKQRNTVERCINRLKQWRGLATRYEKTAIIYLAALHIAAIFIWSAR